MRSVLRQAPCKFGITRITGFQVCREILLVTRSEPHISEALLAFLPMLTSFRLELQVYGWHSWDGC